MLGFSLSTFIAEIVNFLILIWLLTRFFYQPVMRALVAREQRIKADLQHAQEAQDKAAELTARYEARLADWEREKSQLRERFDAGLAAERTRREDELKAALERERQQAEAARRLHERDEHERLVRLAAQDAVRFGSRLFSRLASPELEHRLIDVTVQDLGALSAEQRSTLVHALNGKSTVTVTTRYALNAGEKSAIIAVLQELLGTTPQLSFKQDEALISGIRIELGNAIIDGNLGAELRWFAGAETNVAR